MSKAIAFRSKKAKGTRLEKKFAQLIRLKGLDKDARRIILSGSAFGFETDIYTKLPYSFEVKNHEKVKLWEFWEQARAQGKPMKPPVLVVSGNFRPVLCVLDANDFLNLLKTIQDLELLRKEGNENKS